MGLLGYLFDVLRSNIPALGRISFCHLRLSRGVWLVPTSRWFNCCLWVSFLGSNNFFWRPSVISNCGLSALWVYLQFLNCPIILFCLLWQMESLVREMQDPENGVPVRSQKLFLTSIPSAFMGQSPLLLLTEKANSSTRFIFISWWHFSGYDMIEWLMERLNIEDSGKLFHHFLVRFFFLSSLTFFFCFSRGDPHGQSSVSAWLLLPSGRMQQEPLRQGRQLPLSLPGAILFILLSSLFACAH